MGNRKALAGVLCLLLLPAALSWGADTDSMESRFIGIRLPTQFTPDLIRAIAEIGQEESRTWPAKIKLLDAIREKCGAIDPTYVGLLLSRNPLLSSKNLEAVPSSPQQIIFPACAMMPETARYEVRKGDSLDSITRRKQIPFDSHLAETEDAKEIKSQALSKTLEKLDRVAKQNVTGLQQFHMQRNTERFFEENRGLKHTKIKEGQVLWLPGAQPVWSSVQLKEDIGSDGALKRVEAAVGQGTNVYNLAQPLPQAELIGGAGPLSKCSSQPTGENWPINISSLLEVLASNKMRREQRGLTDPLGEARILILDTGFDFPNGSLEIPKQYVLPTNGLSRLRSSPHKLGVNFAMKKDDARTFSKDPERWHGVGVAGAALGGQQLEPLRNLMSIPIKITFGNVWLSNGQEGIFIDPTSFDHAYKYAAENRIQIINASLEVFEKTAGFDTALRLHGENVVLIGAAGNDSADLSNKRAWPGRLGGDPANALGANIITVGALDSNGNMAEFSRRSSKFVDLLAPGCNIPTYEGSEVNGQLQIAKATRAGTSFAAPIVSFVAGMLIAHNLEVKKVKPRLIASVDVRPELESKTYSHGTLNITKALSLYDDVIELRDRPGQLLFGNVLNRNEVFNICNKEFKVSDLAKIAILKKDTELQAYIWLQNTFDNNNPQAMEPYNCKLQAGQKFRLNFTDRSGQLMNVNIDALLDYVPAAFSAS